MIILKNFSYTFIKPHFANHLKTTSLLVNLMSGHNLYLYLSKVLTLKVPKVSTIEIANRADSNEAAHTELPHFDLHCLPFSLNSQCHI